MRRRRSSRSCPYERAPVPEIDNARDSSEAGPSTSRQVLTRNAVRLKTQNIPVSLENPTDSSSSTLANTPTCSFITRDCDCIIGQLIKTSLMKRDITDQSELFSRGRPMQPSMQPILLGDGKTNFKQFYHHCDWICACVKLKRLFCWPCILFNKNTTGWDLKSINNINNLMTLKISHEFSPGHCSALINFTEFQNYLASSSHQKHLDEEIYNQFVTKNRFIISRLIQIIFYLTHHKLPLDKAGILAGSNNFSELWRLIRHFDPSLSSFSFLNKEKHLSKYPPSVFIDLSESISNSFLAFIKQDLTHAKYLTIMLEEIKSSQNVIKLASVLRYASKHGVVRERFIGLSELAKDRLIFHHVNDLLEKYSHGKKLAGLSFSGPSFFDKKNIFLFDQIKVRHNEVTYIHSYSHNLLQTIATFVNYHRGSKLFFSFLLDISNVFPKLYYYLPPRSGDWMNEKISWDYDTKLVHTVYRYRNEIPLTLKRLLDIKVLGQDIMLKAKGIMVYMETFEFSAFLFFFVEIFSIDVPIFELIIDDVCNVNQYMRNIDRFVEGMDTLINRFPIIWENIMNETCLAGAQPDDELKSNYERVFTDIKSIIISNIRDRRFTDVRLLKFTNLLEPKLFDSFSKNFPRTLFNEIKSTRYMCMFDMKKLKTELRFVYKNELFQKDNIYAFYKYFRSKKIDDILPETSKLGEFLVTLPLGPALPDKLYSASSRIRQYLKDPLPRGMSTTGAMLTIERRFLNKVKRNSVFENYIIDDFARKKSVIELDYKHNL